MGVGEGGPTSGVWTPIAGNLTTLDSGCGTLIHMSSCPSADLVLASVQSNGLWSNEAGTTNWTALGTGPGVTNGTSSILYDPDNPGTFYQSGTYGPCAYKTTDDGATFTMLGSATHCDSISVDFTDPARQTMIAGGHERHIVWRSTDGGQTWTDVSPNIPMTAGYTGFVLLLSPMVHLAAAWDGTGGVFRTTDGGMTWTQVFNGGPIDSRPLVSTDGIYWVLQNTATSSGLIKSTDQGVTWTLVNGSQMIQSTEVGLVELPDGRFVTKGMTNLIVSSDRGVTWGPLGPAYPNGISPWGTVYSKYRKELYIWHWTCNAVNPVTNDAVMSWPFDYTTM
jgi:hypothetical protein